MGNIFGRDQNQLDFRGIHTEQFSDNIPYLNKLQKDSQILANNVSTNNDTISNRKMYNMFNAQQSELNFSDTSPLEASQGNNSATSAVNTEIAELLNKIQKGSSLNESAETLKNNLGNQTGGNLMTQFINEDLLQNLMTETNQTGGFFWNKKEPVNDTFINEETFKSLIENSPQANDNATSVNNTEMNEYMKNAMTELTSTVEGNNRQVGGGPNMDTSEGSDSEEKKKQSDSSSSSEKNKTTETVEDAINEAMDEMTEDMNKQNMEEPESEPYAMTGRSNYESSSAHSDAIDSHNSNMSSTVSANDKYLSDSINTSDINMISVE